MLAHILLKVFNRIIMTIETISKFNDGYMTDVDERITFLEAYGGNIADALSASRIPLGMITGTQFMLIDAADRDETTLATNILTDATDLLDGYFARKAKYPNPNGPSNDEYTDKTAQNMRRLGLYGNDEINLFNLLSPPIRDLVVGLARENYASLGVRSASKAKWPGKVKTWIMFGSFTLSASKLSDSHPGLVRGVHHVATAASLASGVLTMTELERSYQEMLGNEERQSATTAFAASLGRTAVFCREKLESKLVQE